MNGDEEAYERPGETPRHPQDERSDASRTPARKLSAEPDLPRADAFATEVDAAELAELPLEATAALAAFSRRLDAELEQLVARWAHWATPNSTRSRGILPSSLHEQA